MTYRIDADFKPGLDTFCDFTTADSTPRLSDFRELVATIGRHAPHIGHQKVAILAAKPITFGVALQVRVFFERDRMWDWLRPGQPVPE